MRTLVRMEEALFEGYDVDGCYDEMFEAVDQPRPIAFGLYDTLRSLSPAEFDERCAERDRSFRDRGVTFALSGEEMPFPLDPIPRLIGADEWQVIELGVIQRVRALEAFLADIYGEGQVFKDRIVPKRLVTTSRNFSRAAFGVVPANRVRIHVSGVDLVRNRQGRFCVLEDNIRIPSGSSYVVENRRTMARIFPELFASNHVRPVDRYPQRLLTALRAAAPPHAPSDPIVAVLTPGVYNSAYFEHSFLALQMGVDLVEGRDLVCRNNVVYMRTTAGEQRVDVVYRRVDDDYLDPVQFRADSLLGCAGLVNAARAGNVTIANAIGNGVADDKLVYTYIPELITYYLGEQPILANVPTYRLEDDEQRHCALARLDELVVKPVDGSGGYGLVVGPHASDHQLARAAAAIKADPRAFIAQEFVHISTAPTKVGSRLAPRHVDLRPFAINDGDSIWVAPGGLTRVALREGSTVVNSSQGGGSKDTWVLALDRSDGRLVGGADLSVSVHPVDQPFDGVDPDPGPAFAGTQQQQQQQQKCGRLRWDRRC